MLKVGWPVLYYSMEPLEAFSTSLYAAMYVCVHFVFNSHLQIAVPSRVFTNTVKGMAVKPIRLTVTSTLLSFSKTS